MTLLGSFSAFPDGWPGRGLLVQRVALGLRLIYCAFVDTAGGRLSAFPDFAAAAAGTFLILGFSTRVAAVAIVLAEAWMFFFAGTGEPWIRLFLAALSASIAMLGPGAWSVDARRFGRKVFEIHESRRPDE